MLQRPLFVLAVTLASAGVASSQFEETALAEAPPKAGAYFGTSVDVCGDTAVVGSYRGGVGGMAYVFERNAGGPGSWGQVAALAPPAAESNDNFGTSAAVSGDTVVVGAPSDDHSGFLDAGSAFVFERNQGGPGAWGQTAWLTGSAVQNQGKVGHDVDVDGDRIVVGIDYSSDSVFLFERDAGGPGAWGQVMEFTSTVSHYGTDVVISGDVVAIGAHYESQGVGLTGTGAVYLYERNQGGPGAWGQVQKLVATEPENLDHFGSGLTMQGDLIVVGAPSTDPPWAHNPGSAFVFERDPGGAASWSLLVELHPSNGAHGDRFGAGVGVQGDTVAIGAPGDGAGSVYLYERNAGGPESWAEVFHLLSPSVYSYASFGGPLSFSGLTLLVGTPGHYTAGVSSSGAAWAYVPDFSGKAYCTAGVSASGCEASLWVSGIASSSAGAGFDLTALNVEGDKDGLFFFGTNGAQASPWGNGTSYQCVVPPVTRAGLLLGAGTGGQCDGAFSQDLNALWTAKPAKNPGAGATVDAQLWYRDSQNTSNRSTSLSDAIEFYVWP